MRGTTKKIVFAAMFAALACVATMLVKIPSPLKGYINLGDCMVLAAGFLLSPLYGFLAAGLGSALADLFAGYATYAVATFLIKGLMALIAFAALCFAAVQRFEALTSAVRFVIGMLSPFLIGASLAFILNVPMRAVEDALFSSPKVRRRIPAPLRRGISLLLTFLCHSFLQLRPNLGQS